MGWLISKSLEAGSLEMWEMESFKGCADMRFLMETSTMAITSRARNTETVSLSIKMEQDSKEPGKKANEMANLKNQTQPPISLKPNSKTMRLFDEDL